MPETIDKPYYVSPTGEVYRDGKELDGREIVRVLNAGHELAIFVRELSADIKKGLQNENHHSRDEPGP